MNRLVLANIANLVRWVPTWPAFVGLVAGCSLLLPPLETPLADPVRPVGFDTISFAQDRRSATIGFVGGSEFDPADPCSVAYVARVEAIGDDLRVGIFARKHPLQLPENMACDAMGHPRTLVVGWDEPFLGTRVLDQAGSVILLAPPDGLVQITALPDGWELRREESLHGSPTGRWSRLYSPVANPGNVDSWVQLIQAFGGPANTTGGDVLPDVMLNGVRATFYLHGPSGEMVLVWHIGDDGVALVGNLRDFSQTEFIRLAESIDPPS